MSIYHLCSFEDVCRIFLSNAANDNVHIIASIAVTYLCARNDIFVIIVFSFSPPLTLFSIIMVNKMTINVL